MRKDKTDIGRFSVLFDIRNEDQAKVAEFLNGQKHKNTTIAEAVLNYYRLNEPTVKPTDERPLPVKPQTVNPPLEPEKPHEISEETDTAETQSAFPTGSEENLWPRNRAQKSNVGSKMIQGLGSMFEI
jgi:hypothetical protein